VSTLIIHDLHICISFHKFEKYTKCTFVLSQMWCRWAYACSTWLHTWNIKLQNKGRVVWFFYGWRYWAMKIRF